MAAAGPADEPPIFKILVLGDVDVGKTCFIHRFCGGGFLESYISTIGIDFKEKMVKLDSEPCKLQIWDTAGQERYRTLTTAYYRGATGILLMYDITGENSFIDLAKWLRNIEQNASTDVQLLLVGNKCDMDNRVVELARAQKLADSFDLELIEASGKDNINVDEAFLALAKKMKESRSRKLSHRHSIRDVIKWDRLDQSGEDLKKRSCSC
ncbi:RAB8B [Branchiostoma lanceolatum]|uniref:Ras-related protein Rab-1 n=1 Tax=Branchiostoma lanceolatum TaxID=7740 RepID=A0A8K0EKR2_BRALA|nr:RAB8B [Branchiostoma lanceolatum]